MPPIDPNTSKSALDAQNTISGAMGDQVRGRVSDFAQRLGNALMNRNRPNDATGVGQDAYRNYVIEAQSAGQTPMSMAQYQQMQAAPASMAPAIQPMQ